MSRSGLSMPSISALFVSSEPPTCCLFICTSDWLTFANARCASATNRLPMSPRARSTCAACARATSRSAIIRANRLLISAHPSTAPATHPPPAPPPHHPPPTTPPRHKRHDDCQHELILRDQAELLRT